MIFIIQLHFKRFHFKRFLLVAYILDDKQFMGSPWEMYLLNDYLARIKSGYVYGYSSKIFLFPDLKLGRLSHTL